MKRKLDIAFFELPSELKEKSKGWGRWQGSRFLGAA